MSKKKTIKSLGLINEKFRLTNTTKDEIVNYLLKKTHFDESEEIMNRSVEIACELLEVVFPAEKRLQYTELWEELGGNNENFEWHPSMLSVYNRHGDNYEIGGGSFISCWNKSRWSLDNEQNYFPLSYWRTNYTIESFSREHQIIINKLIADRNDFMLSYRETRSKISNILNSQSSVLRLCSLVPSMVDVINAIEIEKQGEKPPCSDIIMADNACELENIIHS